MKVYLLAFGTGPNGAIPHLLYQYRPSKVPGGIETVMVSFHGRIHISPDLEAIVFPSPEVAWAFIKAETDAGSNWSYALLPVDLLPPVPSTKQ